MSWREKGIKIKKEESETSVKELNNVRPFEACQMSGVNKRKRLVTVIGNDKWVNISTNIRFKKRMEKKKEKKVTSQYAKYYISETEGFFNYF